MKVSVSFNEAFKDKTGKNPKVPKSEYKESGDIPVIDQGKNYISGYTSSDNQMVSTSLPVILFGDHTKAVKYVDIPFALGADGVKVLEPQPGFLPKFLYWQLVDSKLPDAGYSRHFKFLKEISIEKPSLEEQEKFVKIRDLQFSIRRKRERQQELFNDFKYSMFIQMFGHMKPNYKLKDICTKITDGTHQSPKWEEKGIPFIFVSNINTGEINFNTSKFVSEDTWRNLTKTTPIEKGDILYSTVGTYGISALVDTEKKFAFQRHIAHIKPDNSIIASDFLNFQLSMPQIRRQASSKVRGVAQPTLNLRDLRDFNIVVPNLSDQNNFLSKIGR